MNRFRKTVANLFGVRRREKRSTLILVFILFIVIIVRISLLSPDPVLVSITVLPETDSVVKTETRTEINSVTLFPFDPNTATRDTLLALGLSLRQVSTLINYRKAGARFRNASDLLRVYGIDTAIIKLLEPYIVIKEKSGPEKEIVQKSVSGINDTAESFYSSECIIELNGCTAVELQTLPGIGPVLSERIIKYRDLLGGFINVTQLKEVYGIDSSLMTRIQELVFADPKFIRTIRIDTCSFGVLARHPYIGREAARSIIKYRELFGPPESIKVLTYQKVIDNARAQKMAPYCTTAFKRE